MNLKRTAVSPPVSQGSQLMKNSEKNTLLKWNTILWLAAMTLPAFFSIAFASTRFPWQIICPLLLIGPMLASNKMLIKAIGETKDSLSPN
jgi:hypothetical protein